MSAVPSDRFLEFSGSVSGTLGVVAVLSLLGGALLGLGAGGVLGWISGYAAGAFKAWRVG